MENNFKKHMKYGKRAFELTIYNSEKGLNELAQEANIKVKTLKSYRSHYINAVLDPKPTKEELLMYESFKEQKFQRVYQKTLQENDGNIKLLAESFKAFLETAYNHDAIVDLAINRNVNPEQIRTEAFNYAKSYAKDNELEKFRAINTNRSESFQKDKIDFSFIEELLNFSSNLVSDYLNLVIEKGIYPQNLITKIDLYIKHNAESDKNIHKLALIKKHLQENQKYIYGKIKASNCRTYQSHMENTTKDKVIQVLTRFCIDTSLNINTLINECSLNQKTFSKYLEQFKEGTKKERFLYERYQAYLEEEYKQTGILVKIIYYYLENGIEKQGLLSSFNAIDYWRLVKEKPEPFFKKARQGLKRELFSRRELSKIEIFIDNMQINNRLYTEEELLSLHCAYNGVGLKNDDEKMEIINYLKEQNIPLYQNIYYAAIEEYIRGELVLNSPNLNKM